MRESSVHAPNATKVDCDLYFLKSTIQIKAHHGSRSYMNHASQVNRMNTMFWPNYYQTMQLVI